MCIGTGLPSTVMLLKPRAGPSFQRKFCTGPAISPFSIRNRPSRVMPVLSSVMLSTGRMYQKNETSSPRLVDLIICSIVCVAAVHHQAHAAGRRRSRRLVLLASPRSDRRTRFLTTPFSTQVIGRGGEAVRADRRLAQDGVADVAADRDVVAEDLLAELGGCRAPCRS